MDRSASSDGADIEGSLLALLRHPERARHLAKLGFFLTHAARGSYVAAGRQAEDSAAEPTGLNELCMRVFEQLAADAGADGVGFPDQAFARVSEEKAANRGCHRCICPALASARVSSRHDHPCVGLWSNRVWCGGVRAEAGRVPARCMGKMSSTSSWNTSWR